MSTINTTTSLKTFNVTENQITFNVVVGAATSGGDVVGPASAVDSNFAAFDSTTGTLIKDSGATNSTFATAAQGTLAASALQSSDIGVSVQAWDTVLDSTTASFTTADETKLDAIEALADVTDTANVTAAGALMDSEVDADIKTLILPANTTISAFGATLVDDAAATNARTTLGIVATLDDKTGANCSGSSGATSRVLTLSNTSTSHSELVFVGGSLISPSDYSVSHLSASSTVTFTNAILDAHVIVVRYQS
jgi:hypothetical protein